MSSMNSSRDKHIDALKGFAILLVVIGHAIQANITNFDDNILFRIIYSFHMPLFMFLSGYVTFNRVGKSKIKWLNKKFISLVIPFVTWYILYYFIGGTGTSFGYPDKGSFLEYVHGGILSPDKGLWFLWVLFLICLVFALSLRISEIIGDISFLLVTLLVQFIPVNYFGISLLKWQFAFFVVGYLTSKYKSKIKFNTVPLYILVIGLTPFAIAGWKRNSVPLFYDDFSNFLASHGINSSFLLKSLTFSYNYIVAFLGIAFFYILFKKMRFSYNFFSWFGVMTLEIYTTHYFFLRLGIGKGFSDIITTIIIALAGPIILSNLFTKRFTITKFLLLGIKPNSKKIQIESQQNIKLMN